MYAIFLILFTELFHIILSLHFIAIMFAYKVG